MTTRKSAVAEAVAAALDEVEHWKAHAEEAGRGFGQVCRDAARISARNVELVRRMEALTFASDDGTEYEHNGHGPNEGEPECPGCWAASIRAALDPLTTARAIADTAAAEAGSADTAARMRRTGGD